MSTVSAKRPPRSDRGRPREFDEEAVLTAAAQAFWGHGFYATSVEDLCEATGLLRGSLYAAYGDKRGMLLAALERYAEGRIERLAASLYSEKPSREIIRQALLYYTRSEADSNGTRACFITNSALELLPQDHEVGALIEQIFQRLAGILADAVLRARAAGIFQTKWDRDTVGDYLLCTIQGLRILAKVRPEQELTRVVDLALQALE